MRPSWCAAGTGIPCDLPTGHEPEWGLQFRSFSPHSWANEDGLSLGRGTCVGTTRWFSSDPTMRTTKDRIRQAVLFEIVGLVLITPLGAWAFGHPMNEVGVIAIGGATIATVWNYVFNLGFDHALKRINGHAKKTMFSRIIHALLFELGLLSVLMPFIAWYLGISLLEALLMDISFALFYIIYAFLFTWVYDRLFPVSSPVPSGPG